MSENQDRPKVIALHTRAAYEGATSAPDIQPEHGDVMLLDHLLKLAMDGKTRGLVVVVGTEIDGKLQTESYSSEAVEDDLAHFVGAMDIQKAFLVNLALELDCEVEDLE